MPRHRSAACLLAGALFVLACSAKNEEPHALGPVDAHPSAGAGGGGGASCVPPSEDTSSATLGLHARFDGVIGHFTRDVSAAYAFDELTGQYAFDALGWKERGVCGQTSLQLTVTSSAELPGPGSYACGSNVEPSPYIVGGGPVAQSSDSRECTIELTEVPSVPGGVVAGTFSGTLLTADGELALTDGRFRVLVTE